MLSTSERTRLGNERVIDAEDRRRIDEIMEKLPRVRDLMFPDADGTMSQ